MSYTLTRYNPANGTLTVPSTANGGAGIDQSTNLTLVGQGYTGYGQAYAQDFLNLLENFAGPNDPNTFTAGRTAVQGQLWYDTTSATHKWLKVFNGSRWASTNGVYQTSSDPTSLSHPIQAGDIWVNTTNATLSVRDSTNHTWVAVGSVSGTGADPRSGSNALTDVDGNSYNVILNWSNGKVVSVESSYTTPFTPNTYPVGMSNFGKIYPGITLANNSDGTLGRIVGKADDSASLNGLAASNYLIKNSITGPGEQITGKVVFSTRDANGAVGRDGLVVTVSGTSASEFVQVYQTRPSDINPGALVILNNKSGAKIILKTTDAANPNLAAAVTVDNSDVTIARNVQVTGKLVSSSSFTPLSSNASGIAGQIAWDANYVYVCTSTNTWKRSALTTW